MNNESSCPCLGILISHINDLTKVVLDWFVSVNLYAQSMYFFLREIEDFC